LLLLLLFLPSSFPISSVNASFSIEPLFSIIWITDTQYLSERYPSNFDAVCNWIVDYSEILNVKAVIHTGDLVEHPESVKEWNRASHSMGILLKNNIPYCWDAGNHDKLPTSWYGKYFQAFNTKIMSKKNYWVGDNFDGKNTALRFSVSDWDFLIINIEFQPNYKVLKWVNQLLELHSDCHTIIATHAYLNGLSEYEEWKNSFMQEYFEQKVLASHSNVFMTLNGHFMDGGRTSRKFTENHHELFFNYQHTGGEGDAALRILTFSREEDAIFVNTVNTVTNQFFSDPENRFTLDIPFFKKPEVPEMLNLTEYEKTNPLTEYRQTEARPIFPDVTFSLFTLLVFMTCLTLIKKKIRRRPNF
jgi:hypothetical protein